MADLIMADGRFTELTTDLSVTAISGKTYYYKNKSASDIVLTYGSTSISLQPEGFIGLLYTGQDWEILCTDSAIADLSTWEPADIGNGDKVYHTALYGVNESNIAPGSQFDGVTAFGIYIHEEIENKNKYPDYFQTPVATGANEYTELNTTNKTDAKRDVRVKGDLRFDTLSLGSAVVTISLYNGTTEISTTDVAVTNDGLFHPFDVVLTADPVEDSEVFIYTGQKGFTTGNQVSFRDISVTYAELDYVNKDALNTIFKVETNTWNITQGMLGFTLLSDITIATGVDSKTIFDDRQSDQDTSPHFALIQNDGNISLWLGGTEHVYADISMLAGEYLVRWDTDTTYIYRDGSPIKTTVDMPSFQTGALYVGHNYTGIPLYINSTLEQIFYKQGVTPPAAPIYDSKYTYYKDKQMQDENGYWKGSVSGVSGVVGTGTGIVWQGELLTPPVDPEINWAYYDIPDGKSYIYNGDVWEIMAQDGVSPEHEVSPDKSRVRFTNPDGSWGEWIDLGTDEVGSIRYFPTYKDRSSDGYLPFGFNNTVSQLQYADLYAEIGDMYEQMHLDAGDPASGAGMFYPTPTPNNYLKAALPEVTFTNTDISDVSGKIAITNTSWNNNTLRPGSIFRLELISGTLPTGLVDGQTYYFNAPSNVSWFYPTESDAIGSVNTSAPNYSDSGSGTFKLVQSGLSLPHALEEHSHLLNAPTGNYWDQNAATGSVQSVPAASGNELGNILNANVSNETRGNEFYAYGYIKVEPITSSGLPVSAIKYQFEETRTLWQFQTIVIPHNLASVMSDLLVKVEFKNTALTNDKWTQLVDTSYNENEITAKSFGYSIQEGSDNNSIEILTAATGILLTKYDNGNNNAIVNGTSGSIRVTIYKPEVLINVLEIPTTQVFEINDATDQNYTLPDASSTIGEVIIKRRGAGTGQVIINTTNSQTIEGRTSTYYNLKGEGRIVVFSSGGNWEIKDFNDCYQDGDWKVCQSGQQSVISRKVGTHPSTAFVSYSLPFNMVDAVELGYYVSLTAADSTGNGASYDNNPANSTKSQVFVTLSSVSVEASLIIHGTKE